MNFLLLAVSLCGPIQITEVMYDPHIREKYGEYVELVNFSSESVTLDGWKISDLSSTDDLIGSNVTLAPGEYGLIVGKDLYADSLALAQFPLGVRLISVDDILIGNGLGNSGDSLFLLNALGDTVNQVHWAGETETGHSIEKVLLGDCSLPGNWHTSLDAGGTPGLPNSVAGRLVDVGIDSVIVTQPDGQLTNSIQVHFSNKGVLTTDVGLELDSNFITTITGLEPGQKHSALLEPTLPDSWYGYYGISVSLQVAGDYDLSNNFAGCRVSLPGPPDQGLVINEFMSNPFSGAPEWVELLNLSAGTFNLDGFGLSDLADTVLLPPKTLESGSYLVLSSVEQFESWLEHDVLELPDFPDLNNSGDQISIIDNTGNLLDVVDYTGWDQADQGRSHERIDPGTPATEQNNWRPSPAQAGHSAGKPNMVTVENSGGAITLEPNPLPINGSQDRLIISYQTPFPSINLWIAIYDLAGRKLGEITNTGPLPGAGQTVWQTTSLDPIIYKTGQYVLVFRARDAGGNGKWDRFERLIMVR
jgi:hypothetical protein